jgi:hypothetical protein
MLFWYRIGFYSITTSITNQTKQYTQQICLMSPCSNGHNRTSFVENFKALRLLLCTNIVKYIYTFHIIKYHFISFVLNRNVQGDMRQLCIIIHKQNVYWLNLSLCLGHSNSVMVTSQLSETSDRKKAVAWISEGNRYEGVSKSFRTGRLERELQMIQLSATRCSCISMLWVSLVSFVAIALCVASQRVFIVVVVVVVYFVIDSVRKLLVTPRM